MTIGKNAVIASSAILGDRVHIGNNVVIYDNVIISNNVHIFDNAIIGRPPKAVASILSRISVECKATRLEEGCVVGCNAVIYTDTLIGKRCLLSDGVIIRENTVLGDDIIVGPHVFIQKNVIVGNKTRIIQHSSIATGSVIGSNNFISSGFICVSDDTFGVYGLDHSKVGPKIGNNNMIGPDVTVLNNLEIGDGNVIGAKALITKSIGNNGVYYGCPARLIRERTTGGI